MIPYSLVLQHLERVPGQSAWHKSTCVLVYHHRLCLTGCCMFIIDCCGCTGVAAGGAWPCQKPAGGCSGAEQPGGAAPDGPAQPAGGGAGTGWRLPQGQVGRQEAGSSSCGQPGVWLRHSPAAPKPGVLSCASSAWHCGVYALVGPVFACAQQPCDTGDCLPLLQEPTRLFKQSLRIYMPLHLSQSCTLT